MRNRFIILLLFAVSCVSKPQLPSKPKGLIPQEKFTNLYVDIQLLEAALERKKIIDTLYKENAASYYHNIFNTYQVTESSFEKSLNYYTQLPDTIAKINEDALNKILEIESQLKKTANINKNIIDEPIFVRIMAQKPEFERFFSDTLNEEKANEFIKGVVGNDPVLMRYKISLTEFKESFFKYMSAQNYKATISKIKEEKLTFEKKEETRNKMLEKK